MRGLKAAQWTFEGQELSVVAPSWNGEAPSLNETLRENLKRFGLEDIIVTGTIGVRNSYTYEHTTIELGPMHLSQMCGNVWATINKRRSDEIDLSIRVFSNGTKIGVDAGLVWDPEEAPAPPTAEEVDSLRALLSAYVPGIDTTPVEAASCLYTMTEDRRFVIGELAEQPGVIIASACSGHGFKFGPAIGDALADLSDGIARDDLSFVSTERRGL